MSEKEDKLIVRKATLNLRRKYGRTKQVNIVERDAFIPRNMEDDIKDYITKKNGTTATDIATRFDIRVSTIKLLLDQYLEEGIIKLLDPNMKLKVYVPTSK